MHREGSGVLRIYCRLFLRPSPARGHTLVNSFSAWEPQETFGIVTSSAETGPRQMGNLIHSWTALQKVSHRDTGLNRRC